MKIQFKIEYLTHFGQQPMICGSVPELGSFQEDKALPLILTDLELGVWSIEIETKDVSKPISYFYFVKDENFKTAILEWGDRRVLSINDGTDEIIYINDFWRAKSNPYYTLFSSAYTGAILKPEKVWKFKPLEKPKGNQVLVHFSIGVTRVEATDRVGIIGNFTGSEPLLMSNSDFPVWKASVWVEIANFPLNYKYVIYNEKKADVLFEEAETDRMFDLPKAATVVCLNDEVFRFPRYPWKGTGVAIPVFSLRRNDGFGVGEFSDISLLVDWAVKTGIKLIQILPVNDTVATHTWVDSYPYAGISVYALHPIYINLLKIGKLNSVITQNIVEEQGAHLNTLEKIDYDAVMRLKSRFFKLIFDQQKDTFLQSKEFKTFFKENRYWLEPYAAFSYLRDLFNTPDFTTWGKYSKFSKKVLAELCNANATHFADIAVHYFIQYHAHVQLLEASEYARSKGIALKGDIPIGIYRNSVDAWEEPRLYNMNSQAGAPPDDFSAIGQNWRFPTYNWDEMAKDNFAWWQNRLKKLSAYFDAFRIDHILGFFRIWEIPVEQSEGLLGYFNPSIPYYANEIYAKGIPFDFDRMCKPYIREHFLHRIFGEHTGWVRNNCLDQYERGCFNLKPEFATQRLIEEKLSPSPDATQADRIKYEFIIKGLFALASEVIFIPAKGTDNQAFFPRNSLQFTNSYNELDGHTKHLLNELYIEYFYRRNEEFWKAQAMVKLPVIKDATNMLICGEDLGMVPACVPDVMNDLGILSLEVQRMPKNPKIEFGSPAEYPYMSVATPSSHDTSTIRGWWEEDPARSQKFYNQILGNYGGSPYFCEPWVVKQIIAQHLYSPSMWAIFPLQDLLGMDEKLRLLDARSERINVPANPKHYWRYRMHLSLEELLKEDDFNQLLVRFNKDSGRLGAY